MNRAVFYLRSPAIRQRVCDAVQSAPDGMRVEIKEAKRSLDQNAKLWPMLQDISAQVEWYGTMLSPDDWKDMFTASLRKARVVPGIDEGTFVVLGLHTSDMSRREFSDLIELIYAFGSERNVQWSEPR